MAWSIYLYIAALMVFWRATAINPPTSPSPIEKRDGAVGLDSAIQGPVGIYICSAPNWTGDCQWHRVDDHGGQENFRKCVMLVHKGGIVGVGPNPNLEVTIWSDRNCKNIGAAGIKYPGTSDIGGPPYARGEKINGRETLWFTVRDDSLGQYLKASGTEGANIPAGTGIW